MVQKHSPDVVMQEDDAPWHKAKIVRTYLDRQGVNPLHLPAQSLDLSPIENLSRQVKTIIGRRRHKVKNIGMMETALSET